jgi:hypothetical protein
LVGGSFTPWINIELGAAWTRRLPLIPFYHSGLNAATLPRPFQDFNRVSLDSPDAAEHLIAGVADALGVEHPTKLSFERFLAEMRASIALLPPPLGLNRWGISIVSPEEGQVVSRKLTVRGVILEPLPARHSLRILRSHPNSGGLALAGQVNMRDGAWEALGVDAGGEPGEQRGIEAWVVGPDGDALLEAWDRAAAVHFEVNETLKKATGSFGKWLPYIHKTTGDMTRCARVTVIRRKNVRS